MQGSIHANLKPNRQRRVLHKSNLPNTSQKIGPEPHHYPQEVESLEVDDVEAAAAIHQHLGDSGVDDDGVNDEWIDAGANDSVRMVVVVEGDGGAQPVELLWHCHPCCKDLLTLPLALLRGELCRGLAIDHVTVMDRGEPVVVLTSSLVITLVFLLIILLQP